MEYCEMPFLRSSGGRCCGPWSDMPALATPRANMPAPRIRLFLMPPGDRPPLRKDCAVPSVSTWPSWLLSWASRASVTEARFTWSAWMVSNTRAEAESAE